jgi:hypothetical protein
MKRTTTVSLIIALAFQWALALTISFAAGPAQAPGSEVLGKRITVERERIFLGELIELLSQECGVELRVDTRALESGGPLCVSVRDMPVRKVMALLTALYSYKDAKWDWVKDRGERGERLTFTPSIGAKSLITKLEEWQARAYERQLAAYRKSRDLTPEEQARLNSDESLLPPFPLMEITRGGADLLLDTVSEEQRTRVMAGQEVVQIPIGKLPVGGQSFLKSIYEKGAKSIREQPGNNPPPPPFEWIGFDRTVHKGYGTADIRMSIGDKFGFMSNSVLGGKRMNEAFSTYLYDLWLLSGDAAEHSMAARNVPAEEPEPRKVEGTFSARLLQFSRALHVPTLCRLSHLPSSDPGSPTAKSVATVLSEISDQSAYMSKWHGDVLLVSTRKWHLPEDASMRVGWTDAKRLRTAESAASGTFAVTELALAAHRLTAAQLFGLTPEWPVFNNVSHLRPLLALGGSSPLVLTQIMSDRGYPLKDTDLQALMAVPVFKRVAERYGARSLRLRETRGGEPGQPTTEVNIQLMGTDGEWRSVGGFVYLPRGQGLNSVRPASNRQ